MRFIKYTLLIVLLSAFSNLSAQDPDLLQKRTYPIDSCLYFMEPFQFRVFGLQDATGGGQVAGILFRSTSNPNVLISGQGRLFFNPEDFPGTAMLLENSGANMLMEAPEPPPGNDNWPGGQPPFPMILYGFVQDVDGTPLEPWRSVTIRINRVFFEDLTE